MTIAITYIFFLSCSTSVLYPYYYGSDSAQFQTIGKAWAMGKIPYRDMFDHKGSYIFFVNMLGYKLTGNSSGVMLLQMCNMFVFLIGVYKISGLGRNEARGGIG